MPNLPVVFFQNQWSLTAGVLEHHILVSKDVAVFKSAFTDLKKKTYTHTFKKQNKTLPVMSYDISLL